MGGVFINYRGDDSEMAAVLLDRELTARFGRDNVFLDCRSIPAGADFEQELLGRLRTSSVVLVVIGPRWLTATDKGGGRRIDDPQDWIRREIVAALAGGQRVIPVLTGGARLPSAGQLPEDIAALARRQYVPLRRRYSSVDIAYLVERITEADPDLAKGTVLAVSGRSAPRRRRYLAVAGVITVATAIAVIVAVTLKNAPWALQDTIRVPSPGWCGKTWVDIDQRSAGYVEAADPISSGADFTYDGCKRGLVYPTTDGVLLGFAPAGDLTRDQCVAAARSEPLSQPEPITSIAVGTVLCAITDESAVAWIRVYYAGEPFSGDGDPTRPAKPTLRLRVTVWPGPVAAPVGRFGSG